MKIQALKNAVTSSVGRQILHAQKNSPSILFTAGVVGVVGAAVLACKATLELEDVIDEQDEKESVATKLRLQNRVDYTEANYKSDMRLIKFQTAGRVTKLYAPAVGVGVVSIAMLTGSHVALKNRNTALMAAYSALDKGFQQYRERVREELGEDKDLEFRHGTQTRAEVVEGKNGPKTVEKTDIPEGMPSIYAKFFDEQSKWWDRNPENNAFFLKCQQNYANNLLQVRGHIFLNEVYDSLGIPRTTAGQVVGWVKGNGDDFVDFGIFDGDNIRRRMFVNGNERSILLDFNVDGVVHDLI